MSPSAAVVANALVLLWIVYAAVLQRFSPDLYYLTVQEDEYLEWATFFAFAGAAVAYAMWKLEDRGPMMIEPGAKVYRGMIVGEHTRGNDLEINVIKGKQLTNIRSSGKDDAVRLTPPILLTLEKALAYIEDDELVEVTPEAIRLRKSILDPIDRKRAFRAGAA